MSNVTYAVSAQDRVKRAAALNKTEKLLLLAFKPHKSKCMRHITLIAKEDKEKFQTRRIKFKN